MISVTLQKLIEAYFPFSVIAKCRDLLSKEIIWFQTQCALFLGLVCFELQAKFFQLIRIVDFWTLRHWFFNSRWRKFSTQITALSSELRTHFFYDTHTVISLDLKVLVFSHKCEPLNSWGYFNTTAYTVVFQLVMVTISYFRM